MGGFVTNIKAWSFIWHCANFGKALSKSVLHSAHFEYNLA